MRTASGTDPGFTATEGTGVRRRSARYPSAQLHRLLSSDRQSRARLLSQADGTTMSGTGGPHDLEELPVPAAEAVRGCPLIDFGARPSTRAAKQSTPNAPAFSDLTPGSALSPSRDAGTHWAAAGRGRATARASTPTAADDRSMSAGSAAHAHTTDLQALLGTAPPADKPALVAVDASHNRAAPRTTPIASSPGSPITSRSASPDSWTCCGREIGGGDSHA